MKLRFLCNYYAWYNRLSMDETKRKKPFIIKVRDWLKKHYIPLLGLLLVVTIIVIAGVFYYNNPGILEDLEGYGYAGAFVISIILNATLIIPVSNMAIIFSLGAVPALSPLFVGLAGGIGAGIGEMTGYIAGRSGRGLLAKNKVYTRVEKWVIRWGWIAVFVLSIFPLFFDVVGIIAGAMRMPIWKFFLACWLGRTVSYVTVAYLAHYGFQLWFMGS
jgi:membrane protein YqaA with SNARE-associated domain